MINEYVLRGAIFIYKRKDVSDGAYCSDSPSFYLQQHDVGFKGKEAALLAGKPVDSDRLKDICSLMLPGLRSDLRFLNSRVLASSWSSHGPDIWWVPPARRGIFFHASLKIPNGVIHWPGLVMAATDRELQVFAVKGKERPTEKTALFIAPFFNMRGSDICLGSAGIPVSASDYEGWEKAFFKSAFSEDRGEKRVKGASLASFWSKLMKENPQVFPENKLISCGGTVGDLLQELK